MFGGFFGQRDGGSLFFDAVVVGSEIVVDELESQVVSRFVFEPGLVHLQGDEADLVGCAIRSVG